MIEFSRLELEGTPVSKRKLKPLVEGGLVQGWDDPRLPTLAALRRRGITPEAIREFVLSMGVTKVESTPTWSILEAINRKLIDPTARRYFFVPDPVQINVQGFPKGKVRLRLHPDRELGDREVKTANTFYIPLKDLESLKVGDEFRLLELCNLRLEELKPNIATCAFVSKELRAELPKFQWVTEESFSMKVLVPRNLFVGEEFNPNSLATVGGVAEAACKNLRPGDMVQFVRFGFCRIDDSGIAIMTHK